jgi:hypothetical protein
LSFEIAAPDIAVVDEALNSEEFDVLAFVRGANLPTDTETIFTDADAAVRMAALLEEEEHAENDPYSITDGNDAIDDELTELHERLVESALEFTLQGLAPRARVALENHLKATLPYKEGDLNPEYYEALTNEVVARSIKSVTNAASGKTSTAAWDATKVADFFVDLYPTEQAKLYNKAMGLTYIQAEVFDRAVNADFS